MPRYDFRSPRLYVAAPLSPGAKLSLDGPQANYLRNVLRLQAGAPSVPVNLLDQDRVEPAQKLHRTTDVGGRKPVDDLERGRYADGHIHQQELRWASPLRDRHLVERTEGLQVDPIAIEHGGLVGGEFRAQLDRPFEILNQVVDSKRRVEFLESQERPPYAARRFGRLASMSHSTAPTPHLKSRWTV